MREKTGTAESIAPEEMPGKVSEVFAAGTQNEWEQFWDSYQTFGNRRDYSGAFYGLGWTNETFKPKYPIIVTGTLEYIFRNSRITGDLNMILENLGVYLDTEGITGGSQWFLNSRFTRIPKIDMSKVTTGTQQFASNFHEEIHIVASSTTTWNKTFQNCHALVELTIEGKIGQNGFAVDTSPLLTHESLVSIINALEDYSADTGGAEWKVTLGDANLVKLNEEEIGIAEAKGWVLA